MIAQWAAYTWKKKNRILWAGSVVFLLLVWLLAVRPTLTLRSTYMELREGAAGKDAALAQLQMLRGKAAEMRLHEKADGNQQDKPEVEWMAGWAASQGVRLLQIPLPDRLTAHDVTVNFQAYKLEGGFKQLLRFLEAVGKERQIRVLSAVFRKELDPHTRLPRLCLQLHTVRVVKDE